VQLAAELDVSRVVPLLRDDTFTNYAKEPSALN